MKAIVGGLVLLALFNATSCKKCYTCENPTSHESSKFCKGDYRYEILKNGGSVTDNNGAVVLICN